MKPDAATHCAPHDEWIARYNDRDKLHVAAVMLPCPSAPLQCARRSAPRTPCVRSASRAGPGWTSRTSDTTFGRDVSDWQHSPFADGPFEYVRPEATRLGAERLAAIAAEDEAFASIPLSHMKRRSAALNPRRPLTEAHKAKIAAAKTGKPGVRHSAQTREAISRGIRWSFANTEHAAKIGASRLGTKYNVKPKLASAPKLVQSGGGPRICHCSVCHAVGHNARTCPRRAKANGANGESAVL